MVVPFPTPPNVKLFVSLFGVSAIPANSILQYFITPELSASSVPPKVTAGVMPSIVGLEAFTFALPRRITPDQSPSSLAPTACAEVKMIGLVAVPTALILPPLSMIRAALVALSPMIIVPAGIVSV